MLSRANEWVWDSWYVVDGDDLHAFYLMAPKDLPHPDMRHINARVGHSVSSNGRDWEHLPEALGPSDDDGFDSQAIWTGSVVRDGGRWHFFYTGINKVNQIGVQAIGHAVSDDLVSWTRLSHEPILRAAHPYRVAADTPLVSEPFRDPWVFKLDDGWHMTVTAVDADGWGTIAHATSPDLDAWTLQGPLVTESRFQQLEVTQFVTIEGRSHLIFCMGAHDVHRDGIERALGTYSVPLDGPMGPIDLNRTTVLGRHVYAGRVVEFKGQHLLLGFTDTGDPADFTGTIGDPIPVKTAADGSLRIVE